MGDWRERPPIGQPVEARRSRLVDIANPFGLTEALIGLAVGFVLASLFASAFQAIDKAAGHRSPGSFGTDVASLVGLWIGFFGAALVASRINATRPVPAASVRPMPGRSSVLGRVTDDYGLRLAPWPDIPLGIAVGLLSQYLLVPLLELPLLPFVPHLFHRLGGPAENLTGSVRGAGFVVLALLVCAGSPFFEELFFRGVLLRALAGRLEGLGRRLGPVLAMALTGIVFGLVHFEALQLLALIGFGIVLCVLAWRTGRLGPGIVAHATFNTVTIVAIALSR